jgi:hypothetical protein
VVGPELDGGSPVTGYDVLVNSSSHVPAGSNRSTTISVLPGGTVTARVRAKNATGGWGLWSDPLETKGKGRPAPPDDLHTTPITGGVRLTWTSSIGDQSGGRTVRYYRAVVAHGKDNVQKTVNGGNVSFLGFEPGAKLEVAVVTHTEDADGLGDLESIPDFVVVTVPDTSSSSGPSTPGGSAPGGSSAGAGSATTGSESASSTHGSVTGGTAMGGAEPNQSSVAKVNGPGDSTTVLADAPVNHAVGATSGTNRGGPDPLLLIAIVALTALLLAPAALWWRHRSRRTGELS